MEGIKYEGEVREVGGLVVYVSGGGYEVVEVVWTGLCCFGGEDGGREGRGVVEVGLRWEKRRVDRVGWRVVIYVVAGRICELGGLAVFNGSHLGRYDDGGNRRRV